MHTRDDEYSETAYSRINVPIVFRRNVELDTLAEIETGISGYKR